MSIKQKKWAYLSLTAGGLTLCEKIRRQLDGEILTLKKRADAHTDEVYDSFQGMVDDAFSRYDCLVFVMAAGIVVRSIAELIRGKTKDPAVLVLDEKGEYCVSLLSGHIGGANDFAKQVGLAIGAWPVITTASDVTGKTAVDTLAEQLNCVIGDISAAKDITAKIINGEKVMACGEVVDELPAGLTRDAKQNAAQYDAAIYIGEERKTMMPVPFVQLIPKTIIAGMGCTKGTSCDDICALIAEALKKVGIHSGALAGIVSVEIKENEAGLIAAAEHLGVPFNTISIEEIRKAEHLFEGSGFVKETIGVSCVAQPCGYIASGHGENLIDIIKKNGMTISLRRKNDKQKPKGRISIVSTGPGSIDQMTPAARRVIESCDVVTGYTRYMDLIQSLIQHKTQIKTGMHHEAERCQMAVDAAKSGKQAVMVSGGDAGVYGMAGLVYEIIEKEGLFDKIDIEVIPGITSATASAALLGAPLMHDFVVISLSDWLTSAETIEKRLDCAGRGDFVVVIYNPKSAHRPEMIHKARRILLKYKEAETPVGIVRNAYRNGQETALTTLGSMDDCLIDMRTTVIIGNSATHVKNGRMITPRGYRL